MALPQTPVLDRWAFLASIPSNCWLWLAGSYLVFTTAVGGMVYCVIRAPPPFMVEKSYINLFEMNTSQEQYIAEGLIMGVRAWGARARRVSSPPASFPC